MYIGILSDNNEVSNACKKVLLEFVEKLGYKGVNINASSDFLQNCDDAVKQLTISKTIDKVITVDEWGILPFMYMSKNKNIIVAEINDEHSARMTTEHNGSNVLTFSTRISTKCQMKKMLYKFVNAKFEAGRHMVRIDMMEALLSKEEN